MKSLKCVIIKKNIYKFIKPILSYIKKIHQYANKSKKIQKYPAEFCTSIKYRFLIAGGNTFYAKIENYPKWNTVFPCMCYIKLINRKIIFNTYAFRHVC